MYLLGYDLELPGPIDRLSSRHPSVSWAAHPLGPRWVIRCTGPAEAVREVAALGPSVGGPAPGTSSASFLYTPRPTERALLREIGDAGATLVPPLVWSEGRLGVRFVTRAGGPPTAWRARHPDARLLVKRRVEPGALFDVLDRPTEWPPALTPRQAEVLLGAVEAGYYELPRRASVGPIAQRLGIARSTAEEHLRAAESTLIRSIAPLVATRHHRSEDRAGEADLEYYARFSAELDLYVQLALRDEEITEVRLSRSRPRGTGAPSHPYLRRILRHLATGSDDLRDLPVALDVPPFSRKVLDEVRRIPPGSTRTYGEIAELIGEAGAARAVGNAVASNPAVVVIPCHRVVPAAGGVGQYSAGGGPETKRRLLEKERAGAPGHARPRSGRTGG